MKVYFKVSIFPQSPLCPWNRAIFHKKKGLNEKKSVLEDFAITLEKQNTLIFLRQPENNIRIVCKEVPGGEGLHYGEEPYTRSPESRVSGRDTQNVYIQNAFEINLMVK